jgi:hypothetical protein
LSTPIVLGQDKQSAGLLAILKFTKEVNKMKKFLIVMVVVISLCFVASQALACMWDAYWDGGYVPRVNAGECYRKFLRNTMILRQELAAKRGEYNASIARPNANPNRARQISQELASIHDRLQAKAIIFGLPRPGSFGAPPTRGLGRGSSYCR